MKYFVPNEVFGIRKLKVGTLPGTIGNFNFGKPRYFIG